MNLNKNQLINLPVYTKSGQKLGRVVNFEFNTQLQEIVKYYIKAENIIKELIEKDLVISAEQVISIDDEKMVVEDLAVKEKKLAKQKVSAMPV